MKKIIALLLSTLILFSLCACERMDKLASIELPELPRIEPTPAPDSEAAPSVPVAEEALPSPASAPEARVIVYTTVTEQAFFDPAEEKEQILSFSYETPHIDISGRDAAADRINEYIAGLDEAYCTGNDYGGGSGNGLNMMLEMATDNFTYAYNSGTSMNLLFSSNRTVDITRSDSVVLSLLYNTRTYTGGAHGSYDYQACTFDTRSGEPLSLDKLFLNYAAFEDTALNIMKSIIAEDPAEYFEPDDGALLSLIREGSWYFDETGLVIFPDLYEIASYATGVTFFEIPYAELSGIMDDQWFPADYAGAGQLSLISQKDFPNGSMEVIDRLNADSSGEALCLVAEGIVFDVKISRVHYTDYNKSFMETARLWQCSYMLDCALQLQALIPEGMPDLMVSWQTAEGQELRRLITHGENGAVELSNDDISAVG